MRKSVPQNNTASDPSNPYNSLQVGIFRSTMASEMYDTVILGEDHRAPTEDLRSLNNAPDASKRTSVYDAVFPGYFFVTGSVNSQRHDVDRSVGHFGLPRGLDLALSLES
ncbi:hypothetical protein RRG08_011086 [Elysia crispata]|uniref:Uncharacterized protein n=1 Tax=Elysia crispata TaxID=231223 RepID=A0AAE1DBV9_9GAST|nr:hypothetical protein RRG08_011086 [Elysia crispata]